MTVISNRVETALRHLLDKDYENALIQISIAIDATAKKKRPRLKPGKRIRNMIEEYETFIYGYAAAFFIKVRKGGGKLTLIIDGQTLAEIFYKSIRCVIQHGDELENYIILTEKQIVGSQNGKIVISANQINAFLFCVVCDPVNKNEKCDSSFEISFRNKKLKINEMRGDLEKMRDTLD